MIIHKKKLFATIISLVLAIFIVNAQGGNVSYFQAMYIKNFMRYIEFPNKGSKTVIGVMGNSQIIIDLQKVTDANSYVIKKVTNTADLAGCNVIFIPKNDYKNLSLIKQLGINKFLIICEDNTLEKKGADISFYTEGDKLKFSIDKTSIESKGIKLSHELLKLGKEI